MKILFLVFACLFSGYVTAQNQPKPAATQPATAPPAKSHFQKLNTVTPQAVDPKGQPMPADSNGHLRAQIPPVAPEGTPANTGKSAIKFEKLTYDFGKIKQGEVVKYAFKLTNTGKNPITFDAVRASCGCTTPAYPKGPIAPGASESVDIKFDSNGKMGPQQKTVTIRTNETDNNLIILTIKGEIFAPTAAPTAPPASK